MAGMTSRHNADTQSHCTRIAVVAEAPKQGIYFPLTNAVFIGEHRHGIRNFLPGNYHIVEFPEKVYIPCILKSHTYFAEPFKQLSVEFQYLKYRHIRIIC